MDKHLIAYGNKSGLPDAISEFQPQTSIIENVTFFKGEKFSKNHFLRGCIWSQGLYLESGVEFPKLL